MSHSLLAFGAVVGLSYLAAPTSRVQRDQAVAAAGSGSISGVVEIAGTGERIKGAVVTLSVVGRQIKLDAITDENGRFSYEKLPGGTYGLSARRPSFVPIPYGASRPGRIGLPIALRDGQRLSGLRVQLAPGSVITGIVRDESGAPLSDMEVRVEPQGRPGRAQTAVTRTNHRGEYRAYGLSAGSYIVSTRPVIALKGDFEQPSTAEVDAALRRIQLRRTGIAGAGSSASGSSAGVIPLVRKGSGVAVYHINAFNRADATLIDLATGEERGGVDISFRLMPASSVAGGVSGWGGYRNVDVELALRPIWAQSPNDVIRTSPDPDGTFSFAGVVPGRYTLAARLVARSQRCLHASEDIVVQGGDVLGVRLSLRPCATVVGQVRTVTQTPRLPPALLGLRVELRPNGLVSPFRPGLATAVDQDGRFVLGDAGDLIAGEFYLVVDVPGAAPGRGWRVESAEIGANNILDDGLPIAGESASQALTLVLSDQHNSLSGTLVVDSTQVASQFTVVVVTANPAWWKEPFRRVFAVRAGDDGRFRLEDLPPGDYYMAAMTDLAPDSWRDPALLKEIASSGMPISIGATEHKVQAVRIAR